MDIYTRATSQSDSFNIKSAFCLQVTYRVVQVTDDQLEATADGTGAVSVVSTAAFAGAPQAVAQVSKYQWIDVKPERFTAFGVHRKSHKRTSCRRRRDFCTAGSQMCGLQNLSPHRGLLCQFVVLEAWEQAASSSNIAPFPPNRFQGSTSSLLG